MREQLLTLERQATEALEGARDPARIEEIRVTYLGKKGQLTEVMRSLGALSPEERPGIGKLANQIKANLKRRLQEAKDRAVRAGGKAGGGPGRDPGRKRASPGASPSHHPGDCGGVSDFHPDGVQDRERAER
jgi:hypothetical protein